MKKTFLYQMLLVLALMFCAQESMAQASGVITATPNPATIAAGHTTANVSVYWAALNSPNGGCLSYVRTAPSYQSGGPGVCGYSGTEVYALGPGTYFFSLFSVADFSQLAYLTVTVNGP